MTLGTRLKEGRQAAQMTLRQVEKESGISNGYLSLLESDLVKRPSPNHLHRLAELYRLHYAELMQLAGYVVPTQTRGSRGGVRQMRVASSVVRPTPPAGGAANDLTPDERNKVEEYISFLRSRRAKGVGQGGSDGGEEGGESGA